MAQTIAAQGLSEWETEYRRQIRRERYEYWRDCKNRLIYYDDYPEFGETMTDGKSEADEVVNRLAVEQATASCTDDERELLHMVYYERMTIAEISRLSGVPYRTLGYRLDRTLRKCRCQLKYRHIGRADMPSSDAVKRR